MAENSEIQQKQEMPTAVPVKKSKKRRCCKVVGITSAVIFTPILALLGALTTATGQQKVVQLVDKFVEPLAIGSVAGSLQDGLVLNRVQFKSEGVDTQVEQARLQFNFSCLWQKGICIDDLSLKKPIIQIDTALLPPSEPDNSESTPMQRIELPISVDIKNVAIDELSLNIDKTALQLGHFQTGASLNNEQGLTLIPTEINDLSLTLVSEPEKEVKLAKVEGKPTDWAAIEKSLTPALLKDLPTIELPFDIHIQGIQAKNWLYRQQQGDKEQLITIPQIQLQADASGADIQLQKLLIESSLANLSGQGTIQLDKTFPLDLKFNADIAQMNGEDKQIILPKSQLNLSLSGALLEQTKLALKTAGGINATVNGMVALNQEKTPLNLRLVSPQVKYPFEVKDKNDQIKVENVDLSIKGDLLNYQAKLAGFVEGMNIPPMQLVLDANGGLTNAKINQLKINALEGETNLVGRLNWTNGIEWQSDVALQNIDTKALLKDWPAQLSGNISTSGHANDKGWLVKIPMLDINGRISKLPLTLAGSLESSDKTLLNVTGLALNYGANRINANGILSENSDFNLDINAPNLTGLVPDLKANIVGTVNLKGKLAQPNINLELTGNNVQFQDLQLKKLYAKGSVSAQEQISGRLDLNVTDFKQGDIKLSKTELWLTGSEKNHELHLRMNGEPVAATVNLFGNFDRTSQSWKGILNKTEFKTPIGRFNNSQNVNIDYNNKQMIATLSSHCWNSADLNLCLPQQFRVGAEGQVPFEVRNLNLALVNKLIEQDLLKGQLHSKGKVAWFKDKPLALDLNVTGNNLAVKQKVDYRAFNLAIPKLNVDGQLANNNLNVKSDIQVQGNGKLSTELKLQDIAASRKLSGSLNIQNLGLDLANQLLGRGERLGGKVAANLRFAGDLNSPLLNGAFTINNIRAKMYTMPFDIQNGDINLQFNGNRSTITGNIQTDDSRLDISGDASWQDLNRWVANVRAKANEFHMEIPQMAKLKVSPDVQVQATPTLLTLSGMINVPWARIEVETLPESAVSVSSDEVILDAAINKVTKKGEVQPPSIKPAKSADGMAIQSDLKINIGDDVLLNSYGLKTNLQGLLSVKQNKGKLGVFGQVNLKNGRYASFGQDLLIRKGEISFSGEASQPFLNIEAIRNPEAMEDSKITAGIKVTGLAEAPEVDIFSEPSMPQDQALSYILTGRSLENSGDAGSSGSIGAALLGLGLSKSGKLVGGIGETFGISDLNVGTQGVGDNSKVVVSGQVTPRLQVKYGVGLFDGLAEFTLRYKLIPQLFLQSVSGVNQAFDLLYEFEF